MDAASLAVGVDVGGTHVSAALVDVLGQRLRREGWQRLALDSGAEAGPILDALGGVIERVLRAAPASCAPRPVGLSFPGPCDYARGVVQLRPPEKYGALFGQNLASLLVGRLARVGGGSVRLSNDAACFAWGEHTIRRDRAPVNTLALTLSTGFGAAFILDGALCAAGPRVPPDGHLYNQPFRTGQADNYFSTRWLVRRYRELTGAELAGAKELAELARPADAVMPRQVFAEMAENLATFLTPWLRRAAIGRIIFGGNISRAWPLFEKTLVGGLAAGGLAVELLRSEDAEGSAVLGAALFAATQPRPRPAGKDSP